MKVTLSEAHATLGVEQGSSIEVVKSAYKKAAIRWHPDKNGNSVESNAKFQEINAAYERILTYLEKPEPRLRQDGGMPFGFAFGSSGPFFFGRGAGGGMFAQSDDDDEEAYEDWSDDGSYSSDEDANAAYERFMWMFEEVLGGGFGSHSAWRERKAHPQEQETPEQHSQRVRAEAERLRQAQKNRENEEKRTKDAARLAKEKEAEEAVARRQQKKAAAVASKTAAESQAADLARKRLALLQKKRSDVFAAARRCDFEAVRNGIYELNVDPNGGESLPGGKDAVSDLEKAGIQIEEEKSKSKSKNQKRKAKAKAAGATIDSSSASPATTFSPSPEIPFDFAPTFVQADSTPAFAQTTGLFEGIATSSSKSKKKNRKKKKTQQQKAEGNSSEPEVQAPLPADAAPSTPPEPASIPTPKSPRNETQASANAEETDPRETLLHIAVNHGHKDLYVWLLDHGAVPEERNSAGFTAFHLALLLNHVALVEHSLADLTPAFPHLSNHAASQAPDPYYPLPKNHTLLSLALIGGAKDPTKALDSVRTVLPFVGGREVSKAWKKCDFEQGKKHLRDWKWEAWEEIKWILAERMQKLDFDGFLPPEEYQGRRPRIY